MTPQEPDSPPSAAPYSKRFIVLTTLLAMGFWTLIVAISLLWDIGVERDHSIQEAASVARNALQKDLAFRAWATQHGGVYVPASNITPPNPYLAHLTERDIKTPSGKLLTLMNPAYALRQIMEMNAKLYGIRGHITSFKLMNPINTPSDWEKKALTALDRGSPEFMEIREADGKTTLHLMQPMITTEGCLKCHGTQGYKVGDVRGGVGVSLDMTPYLETLWRHEKKAAIFHLVFWALGFGGIIYAGLWAHRRANERLREEDRSRLNQERLLSMLALYQIGDRSEEELIAHALEEIVRLTGSAGGYFHFVDDDRKTIQLSYWSKAVLDTCATVESHDYPLEKAGIWADAMRQRKAVIHNDYPNEPSRKGLPSGHVPMNRHMSVPILDGETLVAVAGVGNKVDPYDDSDVRQCSLYMNALWSLIRERRTELEKHDLRELLIQSRRLESIGRLAGGVAHDFNNYLSVINGYAEMGLEQVDRQSRLNGFLSQILEAGKKAAGITRQLLAFSRKQVLEIRVVNLNNLVSGLTKLLRKTLGENITLTVNTRPDLWSTAVDAVQVEQVVLNLVLNARDAMPTGGKLVVETSNIEFDEEYSRRHPGFAAGRYVMVSVSDTGQGIPKEDQEHIFEPFFTTKEPGKGTGLGLATVHGVVEQHKGHIHLYSEPGQGTIFKIYLPATDEHAEKTGSTHREFVRPEIRAVLIVDDDPAIRMLMASMFEAWGIRAFLADEADQALALASIHRTELDLLISDVVMPGMSGRELADRFSQICPEAKVLLMSGYARDLLTGAGIKEGETAFLQKPVTPWPLLEKLNSLFPKSQS